MHVTSGVSQREVDGIMNMMVKSARRVGAKF